LAVYPDGLTPPLPGERDYRTFNRLIDKNKTYNYEVFAVTDDGLEGKAATATVGLPPSP